MEEFRKKSYLEGLEKEYKRFFRAYCRFISYHAKLCSAVLNEKEKIKLRSIKEKFVKKVEIIKKRIEQEDFKKPL